MKKLIVGLALFSVGCMTTPDSILELSTTQNKTIDVLHKDTLDIINTYDAELQHWVILAHRRAATGVVEKHTNADGSINIQEYFNDMKVINDNMLSVLSEYENNRTELIAGVGNKFETAKRIQATIDSYEKSYGFDENNINNLITDFSEIAVTAFDKPEKEEKPDIMDIFYQQIMDALTNASPILGTNPLNMENK